MKKNRIYLEASALWNLFYGEPGENLVEYLLLHNEYLCLTSIWSQLEIHRGIQKRINQSEITSEEGTNLRIYIDTHLQQLTTRRRLEQVPVVEEHVELAKSLIVECNLYASDALHVATALNNACETIFVDDYHMERLHDRIAPRLRIMRTSAEIEDI
ncbi:MAG: PIN domain-containing protein [Candidatus Lokiarchaeota archaeon]|nr:PIN domain-containing protein [Candidatus Lokiarchaeota archaeon]